MIALTHRVEMLVKRNPDETDNSFVGMCASRVAGEARLHGCPWSESVYPRHTINPENNDVLIWTEWEVKIP